MATTGAASRAATAMTIPLFTSTPRNIVTPAAPRRPLLLLHDPIEMILQIALPEDRRIGDALHLGEAALHAIEIDAARAFDVTQDLRDPQGELALLPALAVAHELTDLPHHV